MSKKAKSSGNGANLGVEATLWAAADKLRGLMDAGEYKHVSVGLDFRKHVSDAFQKRADALKVEAHPDAGDRDEYTVEKLSWVSRMADWDQSKAEQPTVGEQVLSVQRQD